MAVLSSEVERTSFLVDIPRNQATPLNAEEAASLKDRIISAFSDLEKVFELQKCIYRMLGRYNRGAILNTLLFHPFFLRESTGLGSIANTKNLKLRDRGVEFIRAIFSIYHKWDSAEDATLLKEYSELFRTCVYISSRGEMVVRDDHPLISEALVFMGIKSYESMKIDNFMPILISEFVTSMSEIDKDTLQNMVAKSIINTIKHVGDSAHSIKSQYERVMIDLQEHSIRSNTPPLSTSSLTNLLSDEAVLQRETVQVQAKQCFQILRMIGERGASKSNPSELDSICRSILSDISSSANNPSARNAYWMAMSLLSRSVPQVFAIEKSLADLLKVNVLCRKSIFSNSYKGTFLTMLPVYTDGRNTPEVNRRLEDITLNSPSTNHLCSKLSREVLKQNSGIPLVSGTRTFKTSLGRSSYYRSNPFPNPHLSRKGSIIFDLKMSLDIPESKRRWIGDRGASHEIVKGYITSVMDRYFRLVNKSLSERGILLKYSIPNVVDLTNRDSVMQLTTDFRRTMGLRSREKASRENVKAQAEASITDGSSLFHQVPWFYFKPTGTLIKEAKKKAVFKVAISVCVDEKMYDFRSLPDPLTTEERRSWVERNILPAVTGSRAGRIVNREAITPTVEMSDATLFATQFAPQAEGTIFPAFNSRWGQMSTGSMRSSSMSLLLKQTEAVLESVDSFITIHNTLSRRVLRGLRKVEF